MLQDGHTAMRITLVSASMSAGGAERVMSILANAWASQEHKVTLVTLTSVADDFYSISPFVTRVGLGLVKESTGISERLISGFKRIRALRSTIQCTKPDIVISFIDQMNVTTLLALVGTGIPVVVSERASPLRYKSVWVWRFLRRLSYPFASALVIQSSTLISWARRHVRPNRVYVIPNPVIMNATGPGEALHLSPYILAMGRLTSQKGFDYLIKAFALCAQNHPTWRLVILGEGDERAALKTLVTSKQLSERVLMPGIQQDTNRWLKQADLFVLSSRFEGFPNALLEAMAAGLAVISFACESGPADIVDHGVNGLLVPEGDIEALADAMNALMAHDLLRLSLGEKALEVRDRFNIRTILGLWDEVMNRIVSVSAKSR